MTKGKGESARPDTGSGNESTPVDDEIAPHGPVAEEEEEELPWPDPCETATEDLRTAEEDLRDAERRLDQARLELAAAQGHLANEQPGTPGYAGALAKLRAAEALVAAIEAEVAGLRRRIADLLDSLFVHGCDGAPPMPDDVPDLPPGAPPPPTASCRAMAERRGKVRRALRFRQVLIEQAQAKVRALRAIVPRTPAIEAAIVAAEGEVRALRDLQKEDRAELARLNAAIVRHCGGTPLPDPSAPPKPTAPPKPIRPLFPGSGPRKGVSTAARAAGELGESDPGVLGPGVYAGEQPNEPRHLTIVSPVRSLRCPNATGETRAQRWEVAFPTGYAYWSHQVDVVDGAVDPEHAGWDACVRRKSGKLIVQQWLRGGDPAGGSALALALRAVVHVVRES